MYGVTVGDPPNETRVGRQRDGRKSSDPEKLNII